jgi:hypothetical protein
LVVVPAHRAVILSSSPEAFHAGHPRRGNRSAFGERTIELSPSGVREFSSNFDFSTAWQDLAQAVVTPHYLFLAHPSMNAHIIPLRYFESGALRDSFVSFALSHAPSSPNTRNA